MAVNCPTLCRNCLSGNWRRYSRHIFVVVYLLLTVTALALTIWVTVRFSDDSQVYFWFVAGISVQVALAVSLWNIFNHLIYYTKPTLQKYIVRMVGIIPAHSINCWLAIRYKGTTLYLDTIRNFYQALVIYSFMSLLLGYLSENYDDLSTVLARKPPFKSRPPCCCVKAVPNKRLISRCRAGVLNYTIIHPIITIIAIATEITGHYVEGNFTGLWIWLTIVDAVSQVWAMYCLMIFYRATKEELQGLKPIPKMVAVQLTVFGSFFQSFIINLIIGIAQPTLKPAWGFESVEAFTRFIQDFILCVEMSLSAAGHLYAFPYTPYIQEGIPSNFCKSCIACCSVTDITQDVFVHVKKMASQKSKVARDIEYDDDDEQPVIELDAVAMVVQEDPGPLEVDEKAIVISEGQDTTVPESNEISVNDKADDSRKADGDVGNSQDCGGLSVRRDSGAYSATSDTEQGDVDGWAEAGISPVTVTVERHLDADVETESRDTAATPHGITFSANGDPVGNPNEESLA
ncbi:transmembrane protein 184C-like [Diadema antillarum]|uniref:transmembrane protein 184C-like n=1 Tax=Diadema antillarum TaxID=105358 RepID=UPI003A87A41B